MANASKGRIHFIIGDTQQKPGAPTEHLSWIGRYAVDQFAGADLEMIHVGDHADMPSLSSYDKGKKAMEGRRYRADIDAANEGFSVLNEPLERHNRGRRTKWLPNRHMLLGNHEARVERACELDAQLDGVISLNDLNYRELGWKVHPFLKPVTIDGVTYAHYFYNPNTGRPLCGESIHARLKTIGHSFTQGHQQGLQYGLRPVGSGRHHGLVVGSTYLHDEKYLGPQSMAYWRGIVVCHQVERGQYDPMFVSLEYLCRRYEKMTLAQFMRKLSRKYDLAEAA